MPIQSFKKEIDGITYEVGQFPAREALKIETKLLSYFGPFLAEIIEGVNLKPKGKKASESILDADINTQTVGRAISLLVSRLDEDQVFNLVFRMLQTTRILAANGGAFADSQGIALFDAHFAGRLSSLMKLLVFIVEVNYADFFGIRDIGTLTDGILGVLKSPLGSETSTKN